MITISERPDPDGKAKRVEMEYFGCSILVELHLQDCVPPAGFEPATTRLESITVLVRPGSEERGKEDEDGV